MVEQNKSNPPVLKELLNTLNLIAKLFFDLSCQDLPPVFEDSIDPIAALWQKYLLFDEPALRVSGGDDTGPLELTKSSILEVVGLYVLKYEDAFGPKIGDFVASAWNLLTTTGLETEFDILVSKALQFLTSVTRLPQHIQNFNDAAILKQVIEKVVLPNLELRESDMETFEDEPIEFIRRDLEGSDSDTRRRSATDFLRGLMAQFETLVTEVVSSYVDHYLQKFTQDPADQWKAKDTAIYLYSSIAAKGAITAREGVMSVNPAVNIISFFQNNVATDLTSTSDVHPILKVDALKYLYVFRSQISKEQWTAAFPLMVQHLAADNYVVYTYAAIAVERVLALSDQNNKAIVDKETVTPLSRDLITHLFTLVEKDIGTDNVAAAPKIQENEFLMRCVMRVLIVIRDGLVPITELCLSHLVRILEVVSSNPSNPRFCYYLFEAIGAVIRFAAPIQPQVVENALAQPFALVIENDVQDFLPYVFQLFAAMLEANKSEAIPDFYRSIIPLILRADYWLSKGNVPALVRLLSSMLNRAASEFASSNQVEPVLGIFKQLFSTKANELQAIELLECILLNFDK